MNSDISTTLAVGGHTCGGMRLFSDTQLFHPVTDEWKNWEGVWK